jgi:hypothetical protein
MNYLLSVVISEVVRDNFLLVADWTVDLIFQINLLTNEINAIPLGDSGYLMGVLYDAENNKLIWSEFFDGQVYSMNVDGTDRKVVADIGLYVNKNIVIAISLVRCAKYKNISYCGLKVNDSMNIYA